MRDKELFQRISTIVNEMKGLQPKQNPGTFAEKYCRQQMIKKKLTPYDPNSKMNHLMSNFLNLQTYVNLQQVLKLLQEKQDVKNSSIASKNAPKLTKTVSDQKENNNEKQSLQDLIRKKMGRQIAYKYERQNDRFTGVIKTLEQNSIVFSQSLKNNSAHGENSLLRQIQRHSLQDGDQRMSAVSEYRQNFQENPKYKDNFKDGQMYIEFKSKGSKLKKNKNRSEILHKISTYLQIILQNQHRNKWQQKRNKTVMKQTLQPLNSQRAQFRQSRQQNLNNPRISNYSPLSKTAKSNQKIYMNKFSCSPPIRQNLRLNKLPSWQVKSQSNSFFVTQKKSFDGQQQRSDKSKENIFLSTNSIKNIKKRQVGSFFNRNNQAIQKRRKILNEFTFKNRNFKQGVISKIIDFINLIDQQELSGKEQNKQLNKAIKKFQSMINRDYQEFRQQPLSANDDDIEQVIRKASQSKCYRFSKI